jgi:hypothetical protein
MATNWWVCQVIRSRAIALPIVPQDKGAIMRTPRTRRSRRADASVAEAIAGIIIDHLGQRLRPRKTGAAAEPRPISASGRRVA